MEDLIDKA